MFAAAKDALTSQTARAYANNLIRRYGEVQELRIDSRAKSVELVLTLLGESEPLRVRIDRYRVEKIEGKTYVTLLEGTCSRPWLQHLFEDHSRGRPHEVPSWVAAAL